MHRLQCQRHAEWEVATTVNDVVVVPANTSTWSLLGDARLRVGLNGAASTLHVRADADKRAGLKSTKRTAI